MTDRFTTKGFADYFIEQRGHTNTFLDRIDVFIDWKKIERVLESITGRLPVPMEDPLIRHFPCSNYYCSRDGMG